MRNNEPLHPLQQCLRENGEQIAAAVAESQFREVLEINKQLRARIAELEQSNERLTEYSRQQTEHADEHAAKFTKLEGQRNELNNKLVLLEAASVPDATGRTAKDYAIEHARYMATDARNLLDALSQAYDMDEDVITPCEMLSEARQRLSGGIYEFEKRRERAAAQPQAQTQGWIPVSERLPDSGKPVLANYLNSHGKSRTIRAHYLLAFTEEVIEDTDECDCEYSELEDTYYLKEGWYELIDNWGDYSSVTVNEGEITHWQPLPAAPAQERSDESHDSHK